MNTLVFKISEKRLFTRRAWHSQNTLSIMWGRRGRMVVQFTTTYVISACHHQCCELESRLWQGVLDKILCDKVCD